MVNTYVHCKIQVLLTVEYLAGPETPGSTSISTSVPEVFARDLDGTYQQHAPAEHLPNRNSQQKQESPKAYLRGEYPRTVTVPLS